MIGLTIYCPKNARATGFSIHWASEKSEFSPDGKLAYMRGINQMTVPGRAGKPLTVHLPGMTIWRKKPNGEWRCVADISNEEPPAAPATT